MLISVSGVGPRSALAILDVAKLDELAAAIKEGRPDLLTRASGIGEEDGGTDHYRAPYEGAIGEIGAGRGKNGRRYRHR